MLEAVSRLLGASECRDCHALGPPKSTLRHPLAVSEGEARLAARVVELCLACRAAAVIKASRRSCNARADV